MVVLTLTECVDNFDEYFLEDIFSQALIFNKEIDGGVNLLLMAVQQLLERAFITFQIKRNKLLVVKQCNLHY